MSSHVTIGIRILVTSEEARVIVITEMAAGLGAREIHFLGPFALPS